MRVIAIGFLVILIGFLLVFLGTIVSVTQPSQTNASLGGVIFIGPFPIIFGNKGFLENSFTVYLLAGVSTLLVFFYIISFILSYRRNDGPAGN